jgi:hypothetical protein
MSAAPDKQQRIISDSTELAQRVKALLEGLHFGTIRITVHEGRIVQIERREKIRLPA